MEDRMPGHAKKTIHLELDAGMLVKLAELNDFHDEPLEETIRICIRHEWNSLQMFIAECEEAGQNPAPPTPESDEEIPW